MLLTESPPTAPELLEFDNLELRTAFETILEASQHGNSDDRELPPWKRLRTSDNTTERPMLLSEDFSSRVCSILHANSEDQDNITLLIMLVSFDVLLSDDLAEP